MATRRTIEDFKRDMRERQARTTPGDEERKSRIKANGLECLRRLHGDQTWEDWEGVAAAMEVITEEALAAVGAGHWDKDNKRVVKEFNRRWEQYEATLGSNYKPLTKQERWAVREILAKPEIGVWRGGLDGPQKRRLNHPNAVINRWKASIQTRERKERRQSPLPSPAPAARAKEAEPLQARVQELTEERVRDKARIAELEAGQGQAKAGADATRLEAELAELRDENYKFRVELEARNHVIKTRNGGGLTSAQFRMLQMLGHPDDPLSEKKKNEAIRLINQLRYVLCNEAELPSMDEKKFSTWARVLWRRRQQDIKETKKYAKRQRRSQPTASPRPPKDLPRA